MNNRVIVIIVLLIVAFLAGFVPQYMKVSRLENDLSASRQENALSQLRELSALTFVQATQKNYGLAAGTSTQFFTRTREMAQREADATMRKALEDLLESQDKITAELAKGDPGALDDLRELFEKARHITASIELPAPVPGA